MTCLTGFAIVHKRVLRSAIKYPILYLKGNFLFSFRHDALSVPVALRPSSSSYILTKVSLSTTGLPLRLGTLGGVDFASLFAWALVVTAHASCQVGSGSSAGLTPGTLPMIRS